MTWHIPYLESFVPKWMIKVIYPIDKTDLDMLRFTHFLALALLVARYFPRKSEILGSKWLRPLILCGQHSLPLFASAYSCPLQRIGSWFSTPRAAHARSGCSCSSASAAS